jgi:hypothetical protein
MANSFGMTAVMSLSAILWVTTSPYTTATELKSFARRAGIRKELVMQQKAPKSIGTTNNTANSPEWELHELTPKLIWWADIFNNAFLKDQSVPPPSISKIKPNLITIGRHIIGSYEIGGKENYGKVQFRRPLWEILVIVMHEMTHTWQALFGKPSNSWYHNREFCCKLLEFGVVCNKTGRNYGVKDTFVSLLKRHGIVFNQPMNTDDFIKIPPVAKPKGKSKLKKWSCGCTNVRVAVKDFQAKCIRCGNYFKRAIP